MIAREACVLAVVIIGFLGIILKKNCILKIISMDVMSAGVIVLYSLISSRTGVFTPIHEAGKKVAYADPVPQAVILTAIMVQKMYNLKSILPAVIGGAFQALFQFLILLIVFS